MHFSLYLIVNLLLALCLASELDYDIGLPENTHPPGGNSNGGELAAPKLPGFSIAGTNTFLYHIALGRGTQNYTCENPTAAAKPVAIGAVATLFNVTSLAYLSVDLLDILTVTASIWKPPHHNVSLVKDSMLSGHHYFSGTPPKPTFDLNTPSHQYGLFIDQKLNSILAPNPTHDVPWLELSGDKNLIFRVKTAGGLPPVTCNGAPRVLTVDYAAQYWIYKTLA